MDHYAVKDAGDLQSTSSFVEPLLSNRQSNPLSYPEYKSHQLFGASSAVRCDDVCKIQVHAKLSTEIPFNTKDYLRITSSDDDKPADETMKSQKYHCPPQILGCAEAEQSSSHESSFATNAITENASAVLEITHRTDGLTCDLISKRGGVGVVQGNYSYDSVSEEVTGFEEPTSVEQDACNAEAKTGDINEDADSLKKSLIAKQGEQKKVGAEQSDICNDKDLKLIGEIRVETRLKSGLNYCVGPDDDADGVLVLGPCEEQRRWPHSRPISIERRPEGFGFTLRNVVAYPSHIHKIATSLGKRPKDIEPWWVEGKPLDAVVVREVRECGAAQAAGLRPHDRIVAHRGSPIESYAKFVAHIHQCRVDRTSRLPNSGKV
ncbi:uncharacterized protein LOC111255071 isoform X1 [Varroa destructor]|uniref:PDZ domain-containing protein n=1 Tax=Varroa destructor TaxID=109461 RepID=A0A7M7L1K8_VARDE|nr:uncharacterized protein LOC111255071 isoform X1 [Varroa destructor]XP_022672441.1 uncharacterized protein LOC111255071 isoform X1 [Varroa destructor]